jgi:pyridoxal phosphate enzyme (YggS family)
VHILAVSKTQSLAAIEEAYSCGLRDFGENYVQELAEKREKLSHLKEIRWHLIGHLQTNKVKQAVEVADFFHALDSEKIVREAARRAKGLRESPWPVFIEVNVDTEPTKSGASPQELPRLIESVRQEPSLMLEGLMCIPKPTQDKEQLSAAFRRLSMLAAAGQGPNPPLKLSMGMSDDFEIAIEQGANWIRIGRKLFGERVQKR